MPYEQLKSAQKKIVGAKQTLKACQRDNVQEVYVALDAEQHVTAPILKLCTEKDIPVIYVEFMRELGKACGIEVGCATAAIIKSMG